MEMNKPIMVVGVEKMLKVDWQMLLKVMRVIIGLLINLKSASNLQ